MGLASAAFWMHNLTLPVAPIVGFVVWRNHRHHGQERPRRWAAALAILRHQACLVEPSPSVATDG